LCGDHECLTEKDNKPKYIVEKILSTRGRYFFFLYKIDIIMRIVITRCLPTESKLHVFYMQPIREKFLPKRFSALRVITIIIIVANKTLCT